MVILGNKFLVWLVVLISISTVVIATDPDPLIDIRYYSNGGIVQVWCYDGGLKYGGKYRVKISGNQPSFTVSRVEFGANDWFKGAFKFDPPVSIGTGFDGYVEFERIAGEDGSWIWDLGLWRVVGTEGQASSYNPWGAKIGGSMSSMDYPVIPPEIYSLGVSVPTGGGTVSIGEEGIVSYSNAWYEEYEEDTVIELNAVPDEGYAFSHFYINQQIETSDSTILTMNQDYVVEAYFYDLSSYAKIQLEWIHLPNGTWGDAADISWYYKIMEGEISNYEWVTGEDFTGDWFEMELPCKFYLEFKIDDPLFVHSITSIRVNGKAVTFEKVGQYEATVGFIFGEGFETQEFGLNAVAPSLFNYYSSGGTYVVTLITGNGGGDIPPSDPDKANVMPYGAVRDNAHDWIMPDGALFGYATYGEDGLVKSRSEQNIGYLDWELKEITMDLYSGKYYTVRRWDNKINFFTSTEDNAVDVGSEMGGAVSVRPISYRGQMYDGLVSIYDRQFPMRNNKIYFYDIILEVVGPNMLPPGEEDDNFPADPDDYPEDQQYDEELTKWKSFIKDLFVMSQTQWETLLGELRSSLEGKFPFGLFYEANLLGNVDTEEQGLGFIDLSHWNLGTADLEDTPISDPVKEMSVSISRFLFWGFFVIWLLSFLQVRLVID